MIFHYQWKMNLLVHCTVINVQLFLPQSNSSIHMLLRHSGVLWRLHICLFWTATLTAVKFKLYLRATWYESFKISLKVYFENFELTSQLTPWIWVLHRKLPDTQLLKCSKILSRIGVSWLIIMGPGFDDWIYWHFFTIAVNYDSLQSMTLYDSLHFLTTSVFSSTTTNDDWRITVHTLKSYNDVCLTSHTYEYIMTLL
jgi:hypothetical protein